MAMLCIVADARAAFIVGNSSFKLPRLPLDTLRDAFAVDAQ